MKVLSVKNDFTVESSVVMIPLKDRVISMTGYDPDSPIESLGFDRTHQELYDSKEAMAKRAELLESRIASTLSSNLSEDEREMTMPDRYDKLVQAIKDYHNSDEAIQAYLTPSMNRAIRSMNNEFEPVDARQVNAFEKNILERAHNIQEYSATAHREIIELFNEYKALDPSVQHSVLPDVKELYRSYINTNIDSPEVKEDVMRAYRSIPKTFNPNISFDITSLYAEQGVSVSTRELREQLASVNADKISYGDLITHVEKFRGYDTETKTEMYDVYRDLISDYLTAHPRSANAENLRMIFREEYYELVRNDETMDIIDNCRLLNGTTTAASRDANIDLAESVLKQYESLSDANKNLIRPAVIDTIEEFNRFELQPVVAPTYRESAHEEVASGGRYSADYYNVRNRILANNDDKGAIVIDALSLDLKEQTQLLNLAAVKNDPVYYDAISEQVKSAKLIRSDQKAELDAELARAFMVLTENNQVAVMDNMLTKIHEGDVYTDVSARVPGFDDAMRNAIKIYLEDAEMHSINKYNSTINAVSVLPTETQADLSENLLDYYKGFVDSHQPMIERASKTFEAYIEKNGSETVRELKESFNEAKQELSDAYEYKKLVTRTENGLSDLSAAGFEKSLPQNLSQYESLEQVDQVRLYLVARTAAETDPTQISKFNELTSDSAFSGEKVRYDILHTDPTTVSRNDMKELISRYVDLDGGKRADVAGDMNRLYVSYAAEHPRIAADSDVRDVYFAAMNGTGKLAILYADSFSDTIRNNDGLSASFVNKKLDEFEELPIECKYHAYPTVARMYFDYIEDRKVTTINERFDKLVDTVKAANPELANNFLIEKFQSGVYTPEYHAMNIIQKKELYRELDTICSENGIPRQGFNGNVSTRFEEVTHTFATEAIESKNCREEFYQSAMRILTSDRSTEDYEAFIKDSSLRSASNGGVQPMVKMRYETAFMNACNFIEKDIEARVERAQDIEAFRNECKDLSDGIDLRQRISGLRNVDHLERLKAEVGASSESVREYAANAYVGKIEKFYHSADSFENFHISSFVTDEKGSNRKVFLDVEKVVGPNCVIAKAPNANDSFLVLTRDRINIDVSREEKDIYSALSGNRVVKANDAFNNNVMFSFDKDGHMTMSFPIPEQRLLDDNYKPGSYAIKSTYEIQNVERDGIQTVITATHRDSGDVVEVITRMKEEEIVRRTRTDAVVGDSGSIAFAQGKDVMFEAAERAIEDHKEAVLGTRFANAVSMQVDGIEEKAENAPIMLLDSKKGEFYKYDGGDVFVRVSNEEHKVLAVEILNDNRTLIALADSHTGEPTYFISERSYSDICREAMSSLESKIESAPETYKNVNIVTYAGEVCVKYNEDKSIEFAPICNLEENNGKTVVTFLDKDDSLKTIEVDMAYNDAARNFASKFERSCYVDEIETQNNDLSFKREGGKVYAVIENDGAVVSGEVINVSSKGVCINTEEGMRLVTGADDVHNKLMSGTGVSTVVYGDDGAKVVMGDGMAYRDVMHSDVLDPNPKIVNIVEYNKENLLDNGLSSGHRGNDLYLSWESSDGRIASSPITYMNAEYDRDKNQVALIVVAEEKDTVNAFAIRELTVGEFRTVIEKVKLEEHINGDFEAIESLHNLNIGRFKEEDVEAVISNFNNVAGKAIDISTIKPVQEEGDLIRASIVDKDDSYILRGIDSNGKSVTVQDPVLKFEGSEMFVYGVGNDGVERNRIISSAFGGYTALTDLASQQSFNYRLVLDGSQDLNHIISGVDFEKKVEWGLNENASSIRELYSETVGMSCRGNDDMKLGAGKLSLGDDIKVSSGYGILVTDDGVNGPHFTYCNPSENSNLRLLPTLQASNHFLPSEEIPNSAKDAKDNKFVLVDYDLGVAIKEGGMVYRMKHEDIAAHTGPNYYDVKILDSVHDLASDARFVSASKFDVGKDDYVPSVNNWSVSVSSEGRPMLSFVDADFHRALGDMSNTYEISKIRTSEDGKSVEAELVSPIPNASNTSGSISTVKLCSPSEEQILTIESATQHTIGTPNEKLLHYFSQVNELANGYMIHGEADRSTLGIGQYLIVKNDPSDKFGALYKVCGENGEMLIVGGADESAKHPVMYSGIESLARKDVTLVNLPEMVDQDMRWAKSTVYVSDVKIDRDTVAFSYGRMDLLNETTGGPTCKCTGEKLNFREVEAQNDKSSVKESGEVEAQNDKSSVKESGNDFVFDGID